MLIIEYGLMTVITRMDEIREVVMKFCWTEVVSCGLGVGL